jgi:hypothetical protein
MRSAPVAPIGRQARSPAERTLQDRLGHRQPAGYIRRLAFAQRRVAVDLVASCCVGEQRRSWDTMSVKWFSNDWRGRMSCAQQDAVEREYAAHVAALRELGDSSIVALLNLYLHDGQVHSTRLVDDRFEWRILVGDLQAGYEFVTIVYRGAEVLLGPDELGLDRLTDPDVEVLYDEVEPLADGSVMHRILLWPEGELWIRFRTASATRAPALPTDHRAGGRAPRLGWLRRLRLTKDAS